MESKQDKAKTVKAKEVKAKIVKAKEVKVFAPATISNIGPGFDVLGVAIEKPGDIVVAKRQQKQELTFSLHHTNHLLAADRQNVAAHVAHLMLEELRPGFGIDLTLYKEMPIGSGLGSSGASSAAAAVAVNALLPEPLPKKDLVRFAVEGEKLASGSAHADNVAPSILGGICLIRSYQPLDVIQLPTKNKFYWVLVHPHLIIETKTARNLLPRTLLLSTAVEQSGHLGTLVAGLITGDDHLIKKSIKDHVAEPIRADLIPGFYDAKDAAMQAGALGFSISGSGPSVFAITTSRASAEIIEEKIKQTFLTVAKIKCDSYVSITNVDGATILEQSS